ncbi:mRNA degradation protein [Yarrowia sp. B02]|nr:mRNA degradation protein [Yarrowia sp. B02]
MIRTARTVKLWTFSHQAARGFRWSAPLSNEILTGEGLDPEEEHKSRGRKRPVKKPTTPVKPATKPAAKPHDNQKHKKQGENVSKSGKTFFEKNDGDSKKSESEGQSDKNKTGTQKRTGKDDRPAEEVETRFWSAPTFSGEEIETVPFPGREMGWEPENKAIRPLHVPKSFAVPHKVKASYEEDGKDNKRFKKVPKHLRADESVDPTKDLTYNPWDPEMEQGIISDLDVQLEPVNQKGDRPDVLPPTMKHGTDSVLFKNNTVQNVRDPRTGVYNFPQLLEDIVSTDEMDMDAISGFTPPSKDETLQKLAKETGATYFGSTSTLTPVLAQFHNLLSNFRQVSLQNTSKWIDEGSSKPTNVYRAPHVAEIVRRGDTFALGVDKTGDQESLLSKLGHSLEAFLTHTPEEYECLKKNPDMTKVTEQQIQDVRARLPNIYAYSKISKFLTRSQLDCYDPRLPGTGTFDLKTRAVAGTRYDQITAEMFHGTDYYIHRNVGQNESFERELFDMARTVSLKYSLQARIGRMDGIYVAFHNMKRFFGFQYFPLEVLDQMNHTASMGVEGNLLQDPKLYDSGICQIVRERVPGKGGFSATVGVNGYASLVEDAVENRGPVIADKEFRLSMELTSRVLDHIIGKMTPEEFDMHHQRVAFFADPDQAGRMVIAVASHDREELDLTAAMNRKYHTRLLKGDMERREIEGSFDYQSWPWKIEEEVELTGDTDMVRVAKAEMEKMENSLYSPQAFIGGMRRLWSMSLKNLQIYELHIKNFVNREHIPLVKENNIHPSPTKDTEWNVQYRLAKLSGPEGTLQNLYMRMMDRKLQVTLKARNDLNEEDLKTDPSIFNQVQSWYNKRGAQKAAAVDEIAEKLGNPVSLNDDKRHWLEYPEEGAAKIEEVTVEEVTVEEVTINDENIEEVKVEENDVSEENGTVEGEKEADKALA